LIQHAESALLGINPDSDESLPPLENIIAVEPPPPEGLLRDTDEDMG
jgi:hypothetical protein